MTRTALSVTALVMAAAMAPSALAHAQSSQTSAPAGAERVVMMCENDAATRRAFRREHGAAPVFVTADQALRARASGQTWSEPRCMTAREHARLVQTLTAYAAVR